MIISIAPAALKAVYNTRADFCGELIFAIKMVDVGNSKWFLIYNIAIELLRRFLISEFMSFLT